MMRLARSGFLLASLLMWAAPAPAQSRDISVEAMRSEKRVALVVGNAAYRTSPLKNPVNDARAMAHALRANGFQVIARENVSQKEMRRAIIEFGERLRDGGIGLFYYAGHGLQVGGRNYLVPVDAEIRSESEVESVDVASVLARMETARNRLNIVVLDACRDNPFARSFRSTSRGLASIDAPSGTIIAYATAPGAGGARRRWRERALHGGVVAGHPRAGAQDRGRLQARPLRRPAADAQRAGAVGILLTGRGLHVRAAESGDGRAGSGGAAHAADRGP